MSNLKKFFMQNSVKNFFHNSLPEGVNYSNISIMAFDKDNTISPPNEPLDRDIAKNLSQITREKWVVILTARDFATCQTQILDVISEFDPRFLRLVLGCSNGSQIYQFDHNLGEYERRSELEGVIDFAENREKILALANEFFGRDDMVLEQRSNTMGAIFPPRTLSREERKEFDPTGERRKNFIKILREKKIFGENYEIIPGGSTSIDIGIHDKEAGMRHLMDFFGYKEGKSGEILFMGDGFPGNDSPVLRVEGINIVRVDNHEVTKKLLQEMMKK